MADIFDECSMRIARLPQADVIDSAVARRWIDLTYQIDPTRILWHISRAGGVGGSEAGSMLAWMYGGTSREHVERLAKRKLLMLPPDRPNDDTGRGAYLEDHIRDVYENGLTLKGCEWTRRDDLKSFVEAGPHPKYPWMRASLDGVYEVDGEIVIVDFKAPSEEALQAYLKHEDFDDYRAQLNHYCMIAQAKGVHVDRLSLCMYDYRRVSSFGVREFDIEMSPELQEKLAYASGAFWNEFVMQGQIPRRERDVILAADDVPAEIEEAARKAIVAKMALDHAEDVYRDCQEQIAYWVSKTGKISGGMLPLGSFVDDQPGMLEVKAVLELDVDAAEQRLKDLGVSDAILDAARKPDDFNPKKMRLAYSDLLRQVAVALETAKDGRMTTDSLSALKKSVESAPVKEKGEYDPEELLKLLVEFGELPYNYMSEKIKSGLPRGKKQDVAERRDMIGQQLDFFIKDLVSCKKGDEILSQESPAVVLANSR